MNKTTILVALVAGLVGGVISRYAAPAPVHAQQAQAQSPAPLELRAQRFALVNPKAVWLPHLQWTSRSLIHLFPTCLLRRLPFDYSIGAEKKSGAREGVRCATWR